MFSTDSRDEHVHLYLAEHIHPYADNPHGRNLHINDRLPRLLDHCPELRHTHDLVRRFAAMLDNRDATPLQGWLDDLADSGLTPLVGSPEPCAKTDTL
ncbi:hypothetical protein [Streptomyces flavidovirens]|uniref:hypothetical protein n=1 Tax=Streptomyces flavidovirens TaxID=67298 RepID=UPI0036A5A57E